MRELSGKVGVVTGAATGIGLALCEEFASEGMRVVMSDVDPTRLDDAATELARSSAEVEAVPAA
jgi:NAD(P)-dependent dehydrogenase (short-subunit alcohol dehydrogenase family)